MKKICNTPLMLDKSRTSAQAAPNGNVSGGLKIQIGGCSKIALLARQQLIKIGHCMRASTGSSAGTGTTSPIGVADGAAEDSIDPDSFRNSAIGNLPLARNQVDHQNKTRCQKQILLRQSE
jgi:hypothetical protein